MTTPRYARLAAKVLTKEADDAARVPLALVHAAASPDAPDARVVSERRRDAAILAIEDAIRAKAARKQTVRRVAIATCTMAAIAACAAGLYVHRASPIAARGGETTPTPATAIAHPSGDGASVVGSSALAPMVDGQPLATGSRVVARPSGRALLAFATGTEVTLEDEGDLTILDGGPAKMFALGGGALRAKVAKLGPGERFVVRTPDAEVEVRGTSFRVGVAAPDASCGNGTTTRLTVFEGTVVIRHAGTEEAIAAGGEWPRGCRARADAYLAPRTHATQPSRVAAQAAAPVAPQSTQASTQPVTPQSTSAQSHAPASSLPEQNDLFAYAVAAKRAGDARAAITRFDTFLTKYPSSALAESAAAQRMKLLRDVDPVRAAEAARVYLARWPNGFARADAEALASGNP